jgi:hypothetical protein
LLPDFLPRRLGGGIFRGVATREWGAWQCPPKRIINSYTVPICLKILSKKVQPSQAIFWREGKMNKISRIALYLLIIFTLFTSLLFTAPSEAQDKSTQQAISYLISAVANSHLTFIRNGERHTSDEAVKHMMEKYNYFKARVKTSEDFIHFCCSESMFSGKPYMVETAQGTIPTEVWLSQILTKHRQDHKPF